MKFMDVSSPEKLAAFRNMAFSGEISHEKVENLKEHFVRKEIEPLPDGGEITDNISDADGLIVSEGTIILVLMTMDDAMSRAAIAA